jgi:hypothetical protein
MPVVPEQPPEPGGTSRGAVVVGDDEDAVADPSPPGRFGEIRLARERMASLPLDREVGELLAEERRARNVALEVEVSAGLPPVELVRAVDELVLDQ